ncbi:TSUP family transporter [candidate division KSB1 bacterium]|nr:TSUP family transporter [candidate division KSB1 bacterium]
MLYFVVFCIGILSAGLGVGGGSILVPSLVYGFHYPFRKAASTSLATIVPITLVGAASHLLIIKHFHFINYLTLVIFAVFGTIIGGIFVRKYEGKWLYTLFAVFLITVGLRMLKVYDATSMIFHYLHDLIYGYEFLFLIIFGLLTGIISTLLGVGCGLIIVPFLVYILNYPMHEAITTSLATMFLLTLSASLVHQKLKAIKINSVKKLIPPALTGAVIGVLISSNLPDKLLKQAFGLFILIMGIKFLYSSLSDLYKLLKKNETASKDMTYTLTRNTKMKKNQSVYQKLRKALYQQVEKHNLFDNAITIRCKPITSEQAIGTPEDKDYPILKGKETIVQAEFEKIKGHAFSDSYGDKNYTLKQILELPPDTNRNRADLIAALNAIYRYLGLCDRTVHCRDQEPKKCAKEIDRLFKPGDKVLLVGLQPRFLEYLKKNHPVRCVDMDPDNIGSSKYGIIIESPEETPGAVEWCDIIFATGSTVVNGTLSSFLDTGKPVIFYGVTIAAAANILNIPRFCEYGH